MIRCVQESVWPFPTHPLLLLLGTDVAADVGPGDVLRPPDGLAALLAPAGLPTARGVFEHLWDEGAELGLHRGGREREKNVCNIRQEQDGKQETMRVMTDKY